MCVCMCVNLSLADGRNSVFAGNSFNDEERCVAAGYDNGDIKLFDLRKMNLRWETNVNNGVSHLSAFVCQQAILKCTLPVSFSLHLLVFPGVQPGV